MTGANTIVSDEMLSAYLDGELQPAEAARVATLIASNAELATRLARHRRVDDLLREAAPEVPTPDYDPLVEHILGAEPPRRSRAVLWSARAVVALVVTVLIGVSAARYLPQDDPLKITTAGLMARGVLAQALEHQPSMSVAAPAPIQVALSLRAADGRFCRQFFIRSTTEGLACRETGGWRVVATAEQRAPEQETPGGYRTAGGEDGPVDQAVQALGGAPLDPAAEARALQQGWRR
jgi:negative regulator of sigma E activity